MLMLMRFVAMTTVWVALASLALVATTATAQTAWVEAESASLTGTFQVVSDASASGGQYVEAPEGSGDALAFGSAAGAVFTFPNLAGGDYVVEAEVWAPDAGSDSFWVLVDGIPAAGVEWEIPVGGGFSTDEVSEVGGADPVVFTVAPGTHVVSISLREDGTRLDRIRLVPQSTPPAPDVFGQWGPVIPWPQVPVSAANLPDGRILTWSGSERRSWPEPEQTYTSTWDPVTGEFVEIFHDGHNMFCAHLSLTDDGKVFVNGGRNFADSPWTSLFDYQSGQWVQVENMATGGRWYPTTVQLPDGDMFTAIGTATNQKNPERWDSKSQQWTTQNGINFNSMVVNTYSTHGERRWWPLLHMAPNGKIFHSGPTPQMHWIDPAGNGSYQPVGSPFTDWYTKHGVSVLYDEGKLLVAGGWTSGFVITSSNQAITIDLNDLTPTPTAATPMHHARKFHNGVLLPTGEVLVVGGNTTGEKFNDIGSVLEPETWDPATGTWTELAPMSVPRNYHSVAILLQDGRVLSAGSGYASANPNHPTTHQDGQIFWPPYLYDGSGQLAPRPSITSGPGFADVGDVVQVQTSEAVQYFSMIKMSATTHGVNTDVRYLRPSFAPAGTDTYDLTIHDNPNVATPGYWMLFAVNANGVPSEAHVLRVGTVGDGFENIALFGTATQSSTLDVDSEASEAIDDDLDGIPTGSLTQTNAEAEAWWEIDLGRPFDLAEIVLWNRTDCCAGRLSNFHVFVSDEPFDTTSVPATMAQTGVLDLPHPGVAGRKTAFDVGRTGRYVRVQLEGTDVLNLAEVQIHGQGLDSHLQYEHYHGDWNQLPDFDALTPVKTGSVPTFRVSPKTQPDHFGFRFRGKIEIAQAGTYTFYTNSDEGSQLFIDDVLIVDNDGLHTATQAQGNVVLAPGLHDIEVTYFDKTGQDSLSVSWAGPGFAWQEIPESVLTGGVGLHERTLLTSPTMPEATGQSVGFGVTGDTQDLEFSWAFGDGTPATAWSTDPTVQHVFSTAGRWVVAATIRNPSTGEERTLTFTHLVHAPLQPTPPRASSSIAAAGNKVWNVNPDQDTVTVIDATAHAVLAETPVGEDPRALAVAPNGDVWVTNKRESTISILDGTTHQETSTIDLARDARPHGIVIDATHAYVALEATGEIEKLDLATGASVAILPVGSRPRHVALSPDASTLYASRFITPPVPMEHTATPVVDDGSTLYGGEVLEIDTATLSLTSTIVLQHSDRLVSEHTGPGLPNYLGPLAISPDGQRGHVPSKQDNILSGALRGGFGMTFDQTVRAVSSEIDLVAGSEVFAGRIDHDNASFASDAVYGPYGIHLFTALEGNREVGISDATSGVELFRFDTGRAPQGLALSPDGMTLYVHNFMDRSVSVHDISAIVQGQGVAVPEITVIPTSASEALAPDVLVGKQLFYDSRDERLASQTYMSCASCHNAGDHDGRIWDLTGRGEGLRNTASLEGRSGMAHGLLHWTGNFDEVQDFEGQIRTLAGGEGLMATPDFIATSDPLGAPKAGLSADLDALAAYVTSLNEFPGTPDRPQDGSLSLEALVGRQAFVIHGCDGCHADAGFTDSPASLLHDVGTITTASGTRMGQTLVGFDTPTLLGIASTSPYLHDGSAPSIEEAILAHTTLTVPEADRLAIATFLREAEPGDHPGALGPACSDGLDNDGDGTIDFGASCGGQGFDCGCSSAADESERDETAQYVCDDGVDNDGDGWADFPGDPGCGGPTATIEDPACQDGIDNDGEAGTDFDGGVSIHGAGGADPAGADPGCTDATDINEKNGSGSGCGLGPELAGLLALLMAARRVSPRRARG